MQATFGKSMKSGSMLACITTCILSIYRKICCLLQTCLQRDILKLPKLTWKMTQETVCCNYNASTSFSNDDVYIGGETGIYKWLSPNPRYGFLNGGMTFDNGQLHISKSGIYYMYATIRFKLNHAKTGHVDDLIVNINVNTTGACLRKQLFNRGRNTGSNPESHVVVPSSTKGTSHSTHIGGVSRLCKDDFIYLTIKNMPSILEIRNDGFPTNFGAFMIAPSCDDDTLPEISSTQPPTDEATPAVSSSSATQTPPTTDGRDRCSFRTCK